MSHYLNIKTKITNGQGLLRALCRMQLRTGQCTMQKIETHEEAKNLIGYQNDVRNDKANVIIRRRHVGNASNDIGFVKVKNGTFESIISEYDSTYYNTEWQAKLNTFYGIETAKMAFEAKKIPYKEFIDPNDKEKRVRLLAEIN